MSPSETHTAQSVVLLPPPVESISTSTRADKVDDAKEVNDDIPSFFCVFYKNGKEFRTAVEDYQLNYNRPLRQPTDIHCSSRPCIYCQTCDFFVFARKRKGGFIAKPDDEFTLKGKLYKQNFKHSEACKLCPGNGGMRRIRRVVADEYICNAIRNDNGERGGCKGLLAYVAKLAKERLNIQLSKTGCSRILRLILQDNPQKEQQHKKRKHDVCLSHTTTV